MTIVEKPVDLGELTGGEVRSLIGHDRGIAAREKYGLDDFDAGAAVVRVIIPKDFRSLSPSFFQGMFGSSVYRYASVDEFMQHYQFSGPLPVVAKVMDFARETLLRRAH